MVALDILSDGFFAAIAGIGFGAISDPPLRAFKMIAILAALGHACRFCLMTYLGVDIATASLFGGLVICLRIVGNAFGIFKFSVCDCSGKFLFELFGFLLNVFA